MTETPKCPYCGAGMEVTHAFVNAEQLKQRAEPDETCKQLCESFGASANATVRELFDAIEQLNSSAEPKEDERSV